MVDAKPVKGIQSFADFKRELEIGQHSAYGSRPNAKVRSASAFDEQRRHLIDMYADVEASHSFQDSGGQIFDCIPIKSQPALKKSGAPLAMPPSLPQATAVAGQTTKVAPPLHEGRLDAHGNEMNCPSGTVAIRRLTLEELTKFETLDHFLKKSPRRPRRHFRSHAVKVAGVAPQGESTPHEYAHAAQDVANLGGHSILNVWPLTVQKPEIFSLSQQWYVAETAAVLQTVEVGIQVYPEKYGHAKPVLFTYWTADGYQTTGAYNNDNKDFVLWGSAYSPGMALDDVSQPDGNQVELEVSYFLHDSNWWLFVGGTDQNSAVGYYPASLYRNGPLETGATSIDFGGETVGVGKYPPMGSGSFAAGGYKVAAYQRSIYFYDPSGNVVPARLETSQDWPNSYTIEMTSGDDWGEAFYFGGPGG